MPKLRNDENDTLNGSAKTVRRQVSAGKAQTALVTCLAVLALSACSSPGGEGTPSGSGGAAGKSSGAGGAMGGFTSGGTTTASLGGSGSGGTPGNGGAQNGAGGATNGGSSNGGSGGQSAGGKTSAGGSTNGGSSNGGSGNGGSNTAGTAGTAGTASHRDHCVDGYDPDPADATMKDGLAEFSKSNQIDTLVQPGVVTWMQNHVWEEAHFQWHNIRRCNGGMVDKTRAGGLDPCAHKELVPADQEGNGAGDGLQFLAMHRHMIQSLKQLYPKHTEQFEGWEHYPQKSTDVPTQWQAAWSAWTQQNLTNFAMADDPASNMSKAGFESEGAFGQWIQTTSGLHGALHFKWVRTMNSEHGLGNQFTNIDNYMFWKMHGWIDKVWDRYRAAKGKKPTDQDIKDAVLFQCRHMDALAELVKPGVTGPSTTTCTPAPKQTGTFVTAIRTIFESNTNKCTGCHGPQGASANLTLGGSDCVKSSDIVAALVNKNSTTGGQFKLIVPGDPDKSWLYLKVTGKAGTVTCTPTGGNQCLPDTMPQGGAVTLTQAEQDALRKWIQDGATAPQ